MHIHIALGLRVEISARREAYLALNEADKLHSKLQQNAFLGLEHPTPWSYLTTCITEPLGYIQQSKIYVFVLSVVIDTIYTDTYNTDIYTHNTYIYIRI